MATLQDYRNERLKKRQTLLEAGFDLYPSRAVRTHKTNQIVENFKSLESEVVTIAGRIKSIRKFGKIAFLVIEDSSGQVQAFLRREKLAASQPDKGWIGLEDLNLLNSGDFVEIKGEVVLTQSGEISVLAEYLRLLTKTLRPLPTEIDGFTDKEQRFRRRYVDMNVNPEVRARFVRRAKFWQATRDFLNQHGFVEINTPVLEHTTGGADASPFVTHMDSLGEDFYLRISHELPLKRLIGGGFEKVYDIGPRFRNEGLTDEHLPEHVAMEWYWAYANWQDGMKMMEKMYSFVLKETFGTLKFKIDGMEVDMSKDWEVWDYAEVIKLHYQIDVEKTPLKEVKAVLKKQDLEIEKIDNRARCIDKLWKNIRKDVVGPVWLINTPKFISPLSKSNPDNPLTTERFQAVIAGSELGNGYSELNDPVDQLDRFLEQQAMRDAGDDEAMMLDIDFVEMLEYGMPPTCGWGYSERVFWIFEGVTAREGVPFPHLRKEVDKVTRKTYPNVQFD